MYKVLIADDETFVRNLLEKNLQASGLPIEICASAGDGEEALQKALETHPDILVTDISMPFKNGLELIKELQEQGIGAKTIIISGYDEFDYAKMCIRDSSEELEDLEQEGFLALYPAIENYNPSAAVSYTHLDVYKRQF